MMTVAHRPLAFAAYWLLITFAFSSTATAASTLFQGLHRRELERERAEALTQLSESEKRRNRAERLALLGRLAGLVAHEVNNPLAFLKSNLAFALRELDAGVAPEVVEVLDEARDGASRIESIVAELSMFSFESREELVVCSPAELARDAVRFTSERLAGITVLLDLPETLPAILVHPARVVRVLANLLVVAADDLEQAVALGRARGDLFIQVSAKARGEEGGERLVFCVDRNGPGFPGPVLTRTFDPFVGGSAGLGFQLSLEYLRRPGGQLTGRNRPEGCPQFTVPLTVEARTLPSTDEQAFTR